jgi:DNA-binding MarR family transcriptional regulator
MDKIELRKKLLELSFKLHHDMPPKKMGALTEGEKGIMGLLFYRYPEAQYSGDLAVLMKVGTGRIGNALKSLEAKGFIKLLSTPLRVYYGTHQEEFIDD